MLIRSTNLSELTTCHKKVTNTIIIGQFFPTDIRFDVAKYLVYHSSEMINMVNASYITMPIPLLMDTNESSQNIWGNSMISSPTDTIMSPSQMFLLYIQLHLGKHPSWVRHTPWCSMSYCGW